MTSSVDDNLLDGVSAAALGTLGDRLAAFRRRQPSFTLLGSGP